MRCRPSLSFISHVLSMTFLAAWAASSALTATDVYGAETGGAAKAESTAMTRGLMQSIFQPISTVLPLSFDGAAFSASENQAKIKSQLKILADNAQVFEQHGRSQDRAFEFVARSLARDARNVYRWYSKGHYDEARFTLHNMTENCITCHSSLPETKKFPGADQFFAKIKIDTLPPLERAHLQIVGRQFDDAMKTYEDLFRSKQIHPSDVVVLGAFTDYLRLAIGVKGDLKRPQETLARLLERPATPAHVRRQITTWLGALKELEASKAIARTTSEAGQPKIDLAVPRKLMSQARAIMEFPRDRDGLIQYIAAESLLQQFVHSHADRGKEVAEAYYLLGICDGLLGHSIWISRAEFYFESAIRLAPAADFAPKAYALLQDGLISGYSGSSGTHLPDDVKELLGELKMIIETARGEKVGGKI